MANTIEWNWTGASPETGSRVVREGHGGRWRLLEDDEVVDHPAGVFFGVVTGTVENEEAVGIEIELTDGPFVSQAAEEGPSESVEE